MIEFILGGAGSGKTTLITERILTDLSNEKKVILIVPEQAALSTEGAVCFEAQKRRIRTLDLEVVNFSRLCERAFRLYGGISYSSVTPGAKSLIMWDALFSTAPFLKHYGSELEEADKFVPALTSLISEFKSYNITPQMLSEASEEALTDNKKLSDKLSDLSLIFSAYTALIKQKWTDPSDDLTRLDKLLKTTDMFGGYNVYLDSFKGFTPQQLNAIRAIFDQADNTVVSLCMREDPNSFAFESVKDTLAILKKLSRTTPTVTVLDKKFTANEEMSFIEKNLWNYKDNAVFEGKTDRIRTVKCDNAYDEAEFTASDILEKIRQGSRYRDFAVIARDIERYNGIIDAVFSKYGIPCRVFDRIDLMQKPLFKLIVSALNIKSGSWSSDDMMVYLKSGLTDITPDECNKLENYITTWNIRGSQWKNDSGWFMNPDGYTDRLTESGEKLLSEVNELRVRVVRPLEKLHEYLDGNNTVEEICRALYSFVLELGVDKRIAESADDDKIRLWNCFCDALDTMADTIPSRKADVRLFTGLLTAVVSQSSIGTLPSTIDEITVGSANLIRADKIKHVYILGANENIFPAAIKPHSFFNDAEKVYLETCGIGLSPTTDKNSYEELYYFYSSVTMASQSVTVTCARSDSDGSTLRPSIAFERIKAIMPNSNTLDTKELGVIPRITSEKQAFEYLYALEGSVEGEALKRAYKDSKEYLSQINTERQPLVSNEEQLDTETARTIFKDDVYLTQSRLDRYVLCRFSYYCSYVLKLKENKKAQFRPADTGNLIHRVLEKFFASVNADGKTPEISDVELESKVNEILDDYLGAIFGNDKNSALTSRALQLFVRLKRTLRILIRNLLDEFSQSEFVPSFFEMPIDKSGKDGTVAPLEIPLPDGTNAYIFGTADRVDTYRRGDDVYVRVVDYKTGRKEFSLSDIAMGLNLQMLIYLFSIWKDRNGSFRRTLDIKGDIIPAGVLYFEARTSTVDAEPDSDPSEIYALAESSLKRNGLLLSDEDILRMMEKKLSGRYIPVSLSKEGTPGSTVKALSLSTLEEMGDLMNKILSTVASLASEMKSGKADCSPIRNAKNDGCKYCPYKSICRNPSALEDNGF